MLDFTNVTLSGNVASSGVGGAICIFSKGGTLKNCTLADNLANGGYSNFYSAAIFGSTVTLDDCIVANNATMNTMGRMTCSTTETGTGTIQWPKDKVAGGGADAPCIAGITFADPASGHWPTMAGRPSPWRLGRRRRSSRSARRVPRPTRRGKARKSPCTIGALEN